jgi:hypothetical protein
MPRKASVFFVVACLIAAAMPLMSTPAKPPALADFPGWPTHFEGKLLQPLPLTSLEQRFAENFPGRVGRFGDGQREIVFRWISSETRKLHPAADCFRGSGYSVTPKPIDVDLDGARWGSFVAARGEARINVRERIYDSAGNSWTDVSSWYWAALRKQSQRPWWAVTVATSDRRLPSINMNAIRAAVFLPSVSPYLGAARVKIMIRPRESSCLPSKRKRCSVRA